MDNLYKDEDFAWLLSQLREMDMYELVLSYIIAKTGSCQDMGRLPDHLINALQDIEEIVNKFYANRVINNMFKTYGSILKEYTKEDKGT